MSLAPVSGASVPSVMTRRWTSHARGLIALAILVPCAVAAACSNPYWPSGGLVRYTLALAGWLAFVAGGTFRFWATLYIGGRKGRDLATEGPYSLCRNPLYLGTFLLSLSVGLLAGSLTFTLGLMLASVLYWSVTVPAEEARLAQRLGAPYAEYRRTVPAFFPRLTGLRTPPTIDVDVRCLRIEGRRALRWVWIPLLCQLVGQCQEQAWWPSLWTLP